jgi:site-specific DNA recombinase
MMRGGQHWNPPPSPLATRLFDEEGEPLTPSHAVKGTRRYRHYVSHKLIEGKADRTHRGWRLPAAQIEQVVAAQQDGCSMIEQPFLMQSRVQRLRPTTF